MNRHRYAPRLLAALAVTVLFAGCTNDSNPLAPPDEARMTSPAFAAKGKPGGGGGGPGDAPDCQVTFDMAFTFRPGDVLFSDGLNEGMYSDGTDRVMVFTGSGPGFRFDTNGSKLESNNDRRWVTLDFTGAGLEAVATLTGINSDNRKGLDFRFDRGDGGLDLCGLTVGETGHVPISASFQTASGDGISIHYGCRDGLDGSLKWAGAEVTRTGASTWTISGDNSLACLQQGAFEIVDDNGGSGFAMPFFMTITDQSAP